MKKLLKILGILVLLVFLLVVGVILYLGSGGGEAILTRQVESEGFRSMLSRQVSRAMKLDGEFGPLKYLGNWEVETPGHPVLE